MSSLTLKSLAVLSVSAMCLGSCVLCLRFTFQSWRRVFAGPRLLGVPFFTWFIYNGIFDVAGDGSIVSQPMCTPPTSIEASCFLIFRFVHEMARSKGRLTPMMFSFSPLPLPSSRPLRADHIEPNTDGDTRFLQGTYSLSRASQPSTRRGRARVG
ncbi:hypothetical protein IW262DRAFT_881279 [Armillaria fumosa]|nr:hypothetical protein IW262DRAFT_881279 [Armillaria fumosa]